jgi:hypothetical protein
VFIHLWLSIYLSSEFSPHGYDFAQVCEGILQTYVSPVYIFDFERSRSPELMVSPTDGNRWRRMPSVSVLACMDQRRFGEIRSSSRNTTGYRHDNFFLNLNTSIFLLYLIVC